MKDEDGKDLLLTTWIPKQMNEIFSNLKISMESTHLDGDLKTINLKVLYKGQPARNYDYTYFDGRDWSNIFSAKDGTGIVELPVLANARNLQLRTEYMFEGEANIDNELSEVMGTVNPIAMRNCALKLEGEEPKPGEEKDRRSLNGRIRQCHHHKQRYALFVHHGIRCLRRYHEESRKSYSYAQFHRYPILMYRKRI